MIILNATHLLQELNEIEALISFFENIIEQENLDVDLDLIISSYLKLI